YVQLVEKTLQSFDKEVNEWADFISFLGRLLKVEYRYAFQAYPQFPVIPRKLVVAKRLAQSLNPTLPPGVHQKALEVYAHIFKSIGTDQLAEDLPVYSHGLFPFLQYAAMNVKPQLLEIYEVYFLPLRTRLRPVMKAFITALLPGLEEEGSESFDKVLSLFDELSGTVEQSYFLQCLWLVLITSPSLRTPALNYLSGQMQKIASKEAVVLGDDAGLMVRALSATLGDKNVLVQRAVLELLVVSFPFKVKNFGERLYAWLLGPDENPEHQIQHFYDYGKSPMVSALKTNDLISAQKPYKILISLMDKEEIGQPLVQDLLIDVLWSLKDHVERSPFGTEALELIGFVLKSFKLHEEEIEQKHLPLFLIALLCQLHKFADDSNFNTHISQVESALLLAFDLLKRIPNSVFNRHARDPTEVLAEKRKSTIDEASQGKEDGETKDSSEESRVELHFHTGMDPMEYVHDFYLDNEEIENKEFGGIYGRFLAEELLKAIRSFLNRLIIQSVLVNGQNTNTGALSAVMDYGCGLLKAISTRISRMDFETREHKEIICRLYEGEWIMSLLKCTYMVKHFNIIDSALSILLDLIIDKKLVLPRLLDSKHQIREIVDNLWSFLGSQHNVLHLRAVQLIWKLKDISQTNYVEAVISEYLIEKDTLTRITNFERFGIFWLLSEGFSDKCMNFTQPMFLVLDSLRDEDPTNRRAGETWMRWNHKSYLRILQPMIEILVDATIIRQTTEWQAGNETFEILYYEKPFNQARVDYIFETLSTICRVGGRSFLKAIHTSFVKTDLISSCTWLPTEVGSSLTSITYSELFIKTGLLYIESEVPESLSSSMSTLNQSIHMHVTEFLLRLIKIQDLVKIDMIHLVHEVILRKMLYCIYINQLNLQARLLPLLRSTITSIGPLSEFLVNGSLNPNSPVNKKFPMDPIYSGSPSSVDRTFVKDDKDKNANSRYYRTGEATILMVKVLTEAISRPSNRPLLQKWMDLIEISLPYFRPSFNTVLAPLIQCICEQLNQWKSEANYHYILVANNNESKSNANDPAMSDWDIITLLNGFEEVVKDCLNKHPNEDVDSIPYGVSKGYDTTLGLPALTGYVTGVFSMDTGVYETTTPEQKPRDYILYTVFPDIVSIILDIWTIFKNVFSPNNEQRVGVDPFVISLEHTGKRIKERIKKLLEELHKRAHAELVEAFVELWYIENPDITAAISEVIIRDVDSTVIEVLKAIPGSSPQKVINTLLISARNRSTGSHPQKNKKLAARPGKLTDILILRFLEVYADSLDKADPLIEVWPQCMSYIKDFAQTSAYKNLFPSILRFMHGLADRLCLTSYFEDKKDSYQRVLDYCILIAGRSYDQGLWLRRTIPQEGDDRASGDETEEKEAESGRLINIMPEEKKINIYFAEVVIPDIRRLLVDQDRIISIVTNLMYYVIAPALKNRPNTGVSSVILNLLYETSKIPFVYRVWRKEVWDVFTDNRFFNMSPSAAKKWRAIMQTIMTSEKERFGEVLARITTTIANALFVNKEQESLNRALNLRRLSYILFCGKLDQYLKQLPSIAEKLVELFKLGFVELVHSEIYLCLRVLMCRVSNQHLSNFWPGILTELFCLYGSFVQKENNKSTAEQPEVAKSLLAACKFLDLLFVIQTHDFQVFEWMFIADTVNVITRSLEWSPYALLDKLGSHLSGKQENVSTASLDNLSNSLYMKSRSLLSSTTSISVNEGKRPLLKLRSISNVRQLEPFLKEISLYAYQSTYTLAEPDFPYIEDWLEGDLLEYNSAEVGNVEASGSDNF
ncbi:15995_t:CDS:10, partial [Acaulospora colombiana]